MTTLLIVGDFSPQGRLASLHAMAPAEVFGDFQDKLRDADLAILNLEAPLCRPILPIVKTGPALHGAPETAEFIAGSGFDLACLANNHIMDYGSDGLSQTIASLECHHVAWTGAGLDYETASQPFIHSCQGRTIAILNFAENEWSTTYDKQPGACPIDPIRNHQAILKCKQTADHVIVICHGGHEHYSLPSPRMQELFRFYVDAGADAVVNHHTHCQSGYEVYKGAPIFYSVGNFLFDHHGYMSDPWNRGLAVELILTDAGVDFILHHFDQCTADQLFEAVEGEEAASRDDHLGKLNEIIGSQDALLAAFTKLADEREKQYRAYLEPKLSRLISAAQRRKLLPSLLRRRHRVLLLNLIRCESHREMLIELLKRDARNSQ